MKPIQRKSPDIYEGSKPFLFISYHHKGHQTTVSIKNILEEHNIRYWYDNGLHSGDDCNMAIDKHLEEATASLLILSQNSAESEYVKNELN